MKQKRVKKLLILSLLMVLLLASAVEVVAEERTGDSKGDAVTKFVTLLSSSLIVDDTPSANDLAQSLVGTDVTLSNISFTGNSFGSGSFSGGTGVVGLESGVVLGSGRVVDVVGPNASDVTQTAFGLPGDIELDGLIPGYSTYDASVLEFDFVCPTGTGGADVISFYYVFTSEEYNEYVNDIYNDVFGFFLNGTNIALLPDGVTPVSINNVNNGYSGGGGLPGTDPSNPVFYRNNDLDDGGPFIDIEADGLTVVLGAQADINPGVNHMKLAIADAGDSVLDSWVFIEEGSFQCAPLPPSCEEPDFKTYTVNADFDEGTMVNVNHDDVADQLQLDSEPTPFDFIWVAASGRGTIIKIDTLTGAILGEYWSAPQPMVKNPSRTTVDNNGNVWAGNRDEASGGEGSVVHIGLQENGQCVDRNSDGVIDTSSGVGDIRAWPNTGGADTSGGVSTAEDECIIHYVRTSGTNVRTVAVDAYNDVWVGGHGNKVHEKIDGTTGTIIPSTQFNLGCGGYGGLVDGNGILWSATMPFSQNLLRYDPDISSGSCLDLGRTSYGLGIDNNGYIWHSNWSYDTVQKIDPSGVIVGTFNTLGASDDRGVAVTPADNNVWVANSGGSDVSRLENDGSFVTIITVGDTPTGVAVDAVGKVWVTNYQSHNAMRIDPSTNAVDLTVDLGGGAYPYNYSDMTGSTLIAPPNIGTWTVVYDSGVHGAMWRDVSWSSLEPDDSSISVKVATSDDGVTFGPEVTVSNGGDPYVDDGVTGRYLKVIVSFTRVTNDDSPILYDLSIATNSSAVVTVDAAVVTVDEGETAENTGTVSDADGDAVTLSASVGTVINNGDGTWSWSLDTEDGPDNSQTVIIYATDGYGCIVLVDFELNVNNVAPTATFNAPTYVIAGDDFDLSLTDPYDPSPVDTAEGFEYNFDCGGGYGSWSSTNTATCLTSADEVSTRTVKGKIRDKDGGETEYTATVYILPPSAVTDSSLCYFDRDDEEGQQFRLIFTPDMQLWPAYKLPASNPGQFFYNVFYTDTDPASFDITVPTPFETQGAMPVHVYTGVSVTEIDGFKCFLPDYESEIYAGDLTDLPSDLPGGFLYVAVHLDYGLKGSTGYTPNGDNDALDADDGETVLIPNFETYTFSVSGGQEDSQTVQNSNEFKKIPGFGGLVLDGVGDPLVGETVVIELNGDQLGEVLTDADGWYMLVYKHKGKAATFTVSLPDYPGNSQTVKLKANKFAEVNFVIE